MRHLLLLGSGFSRNWGAWLAGEAFEYLLGCAQIDASLRGLLLRHRHIDGFEGALGELQTRFLRSRDGASRERLQCLQEALAQMFAAMDQRFSSTRFEFQDDPQYLVRTFLARFDAIFTLNQDLLLERHYLNENAMLGTQGRWTGWQILGMRPQNPSGAHVAGGPGCDSTGIWVADAEAAVREGLQPYVKLNGSINWRDTHDGWIVVMGASTQALIEHFPALGRLHTTFVQWLCSGPVRLMIIGYRFGDEHINNMIMAAAGRGQLEIFIVDPLGLDVLDKNRLHRVYSEHPLLGQLGPYVIGASRRRLCETFGSDHIEHATLARFFG